MGQGRAAEAAGAVDGQEKDLMCVDVVDGECEDAQRAVCVVIRGMSNVCC